MFRFLLGNSLLYPMWLAWTHKDPYYLIWVLILFVIYCRLYPD